MRGRNIRRQPGQCPSKNRTFLFRLLRQKRVDLGRLHGESADVQHRLIQLNVVLGHSRPGEAHLERLATSGAATSAIP